MDNTPNTTPATPESPATLLQPSAGFSFETPLVATVPPSPLTSEQFDRILSMITEGDITESGAQELIRTLRGDPEPDQVFTETSVWGDVIPWLVAGAVIITAILSR